MIRPPPRRVTRAGTLLLALALGRAQAGVQNIRVRVDSDGPRPARYRLSALDSGVDEEINPTIFKPQFFSGELARVNTKRDDRYHDAWDFRLGVQDGKVVLVEEYVYTWKTTRQLERMRRASGQEDMEFWNPVEYEPGPVYVIGDASQLDDIRPLPGVEVVAGPGWFWGPWDMTSNLEDVMEDLEPFEGEFIGVEWMRDLALGMIAGTTPWNPGNFRVASLSFVNHWWRLSTEGPAAGPGSLARARANYLDAAIAAAERADPRGRKLLAGWNRALIEASARVHRSLKKEGREAYTPVLEALGALQESLEGAPAPRP